MLVTLNGFNFNSGQIKNNLDLSTIELRGRWNVIQSYHTECQNS